MKKTMKLFFTVILFAQQVFAVAPTVSVDPKHKFLIVHHGDQTSQVDMGLTQGADLEGKPVYYGEADYGVIVVPVALPDAATTYVFAVDSKGKKLWSMDLKVFNASTPLIEKDFIYISGIGAVFKIEKKTGKIVWSHTNLFENQKYKFNGGEPIQRKGDKIAFSSNLQVSDQTGKLVEGSL